MVDMWETAPQVPKELSRPRRHSVALSLRGRPEINRADLVRFEISLRQISDASSSLSNYDDTATLDLHRARTTL